MAEETNEEIQNGDESKSNVLMVVIIGVLVLIIIIGAVVAVLLMGDEEKASTVSNVSEYKQPSTAPQRKRANTALAGSRRLSEIGILYPLDSFTVNLKSDAGKRYLKATISLELSGEEVSMELDAKSPVVRDRVIRILTSKTLEEISSKKGKQKVSNQIQDTMNAIISDGQIQGIYFTEFVIQ